MSNANLIHPAEVPNLPVLVHDRSRDRRVRCRRPFAIASTVTVLLGVRRVPQAELSVVVAKWDDTAQNDNLSESEPTRTSQLELAEAS